MDEHGEAVGGGEAELAGPGEEAGFGGVVDDIVHAGGFRQGGEVDGKGVGVLEAGGGGVDDERALGQAGR